MSNSNLPKFKNILILMSGSIACYKVCTVISQLKQKGYSVQVVMSEAAQKFIGTPTIEGLLGHAPVTDMYQSGSVMDHIHLGRWADLILMAPATANTINKMAAGLGDDLVTTLFLAHDFQKPFLLTPAMNTKMYLHPTTQNSLESLKKMGVEVLETASGVLACGEVGYGRLIEPELILKEVESRILNVEKIQTTETPQVHFKSRKKVLITSGGTQEPLDDVRVITNKSSGRTAAAIADQFILSGFDVTYLHAESAKLPLLDCTKKNYVTFKDIEISLAALLTENQYDLVIHAAAVSDYSVAKSADGKINSDQEKLVIELVKNPKLIDQIKKLSPKSILVGFKLTSTTDHTAIQKKLDGLFEKAQCDFVVHNDWSTVQTGASVFNLHSRKNSLHNLNLDHLSIELAQILLKKEAL